MSYYQKSIGLAEKRTFPLDTPPMQFINKALSLATSSSRSWMRCSLSFTKPRSSSSSWEESSSPFAVCISFGLLSRAPVVSWSPTFPRQSAQIVVPTLAPARASAPASARLCTSSHPPSAALPAQSQYQLTLPRCRLQVSAAVLRLAGYWTSAGPPAPSSWAIFTIKTSRRSNFTFHVDNKKRPCRKHTTTEP